MQPAGELLQLQRRPLWQLGCLVSFLNVGATPAV